MENTQNSTPVTGCKEKKIYVAPEILSIKIDNEISLALESTPPSFEGENLLQHKTQDPFYTSFI